jgi:hypothetical protein
MQEEYEVTTRYEKILLSLDFKVFAPKITDFL